MLSTGVMQVCGRCDLVDEADHQTGHQLPPALSAEACRCMQLTVGDNLDPSTITLQCRLSTGCMQLRGASTGGD